MKSYTDLEQSKKLAEIFPLNRSDMCWTKYIDNGDVISIHVAVNYGIVTIDYPCWSLAALLELLPSGKILIHDKNNLGYKCICNNMDTHFYDNPVDACYEMILKLYDKETLH